MSDFTRKLYNDGLFNIAKNIEKIEFENERLKKLLKAVWEHYKFYREIKCNGCRDLQEQLKKERIE